MNKCPHIRTKLAGDESWDYCELTERPSGRIKGCLLTSSTDCRLNCETYKEILEEWEKDDIAIRYRNFLK